MSTQSLQPGRATLLDIRTFTDARGALSVVEGGIDLPYVPRRMYYLYGSDPGQTRAGHAHRTGRQCLIAVSGTAEIEVDDGRDSRTFLLERPDRALMLEPVVWRVVRLRDATSVLAVLASGLYDEHDYIREHEEFLSLVASR